MDSQKSTIQLPTLTQLDLDRIKASIGGQCFYMCVKYAKAFGYTSIPLAIAYCVSIELI